MLALLVVLLLSSFAHAQVEVFLRTHPHADIEAFLELPQYVLERKENISMPNIVYAACPSIPVPPDTDNVNNLRPGNIKVVLAMGDSLTAAMGAKDTSILSLKEYRGLAYSIGGDSGVTTLPNLLKPFVPTGYPIGSSTGIGERTSAGNGLNGAVSGAINSDMLGQAQWLVQQLKANSKINYASDWKLLTLWIGSNNLCDVCDDPSGNDGTNFENQVTAALEYLYSNVPRLFVNLVANLEISTLYNIRTGACGLLHSIACPCVGSSNANTRAKVAQAGRDYQNRAYVIAQNFNSRNNPEFAVVVQPFLLNTVITERSELSAADCFHPSAPSHGIAAVALWNNLVSPAAQKKTSWSATDVPICPTEDTLLYTN